MFGLLEFIKQAGAASEEDTERDGALSYKAETHALVMGLAAGFLYTASGNADILALVGVAVSAGIRAKTSEKRSDIFMDIAREPQYALGGVLAGAILGGILKVVL